MNCGNCLDWNLRASPPHASVGLAACANGEKFFFTDASKSCGKHRPAPLEIVSGGDAYFAKQGAKA